MKSLIGLLSILFMVSCSITRIHLSEVQGNNSATLTSATEISAHVTATTAYRQTEFALATEQAVQTATALAINPTPNPLSPIGYCEATSPPCLHIVEAGEFDIRIAEKVYGSRNKDRAGLIANLFRSERGYIRQFFPNNTALVPDPNIEVTYSYMIFYLNEFMHYDYGTCVRDDVTTYSFPCIYVSNGESLDLVASTFYKAFTQFSDKTKLDALLMANRISYDAVTDSLVVIDPEAGEIIIIPALLP